MQEIIRRAGVAPSRITVDAGLEFVNYKMHQYLEREGVQVQIARAPLKASLAELMGKLLKRKIFRYMTHNSTKKYIYRLQEFVQSLNSHHLNLLGGKRPKDIGYENQTEVYEAQLGGYRGKKNTNFRFELGERVRLQLKRDCFVKGYVLSFSEEIYVICERKPNFPAPFY